MKLFQRVAQWNGILLFWKIRWLGGVYDFISAQDGVETKVKKSDDCQINVNKNNENIFLWYWCFIICVFFLKIL
jgi:hypothetical protein